MIGPHVIPAELTQFADACVHITVAHVTVRVHDATLGYVALHDWNDVVHRLVTNAVADTNACLATIHAEHPAHGDVIAQALESLVVYLTLIDLYSTR